MIIIVINPPIKVAGHLIIADKSGPTCNSFEHEIFRKGPNFIKHRYYSVHGIVLKLNGHKSATTQYFSNVFVIQMNVAFSLLRENASSNKTASLSLNRRHFNAKKKHFEISLPNIKTVVSLKYCSSLSMPMFSSLESAMKISLLLGSWLS